MDGGTFDRLTRLLAGRLTRRAGVAGALAALAAGAPAASLELEARQRRPHARPADAEPGDGGVYDEKKPCGPKPKDNQCRKHKQCCTGYCRKPKKGQKSGRCRCIRPGKKCKGKQKCCGGATCQNRKCTPAAPIPGPTCAAAGGACTADANCCTGLICEKGLCAPCVEKVCASGCTFDDVNDAYAAAASGDSIYIGPGTYPAAFHVTKDITLAACPGVTGVILESARDASVQDTYSSGPAIIAEDTVDTTTKRKVTLRNLALQPTATGVTNGDETLLSSAPLGLVSYTVENCTFGAAYFGIHVFANEHTVKDCTFDGCTKAGFYQNNLTGQGVSKADISGSTFTNLDSYGVWIYMDSYESLTTITGCSFPSNGGYSVRVEGGTSTPQAKRTLYLNDSTFTDGKPSVSSINSYLRVTGAFADVTGCTFENCSGVAIEFDDASGRLTDTLIRNNQGTSSNDGAGIRALCNSSNVAVEIAGTTLITGNTAGPGKKGGGILTSPFPFQSLTAKVTGANSTNVTGNTPDDCYEVGTGVVACTALA